MLADAGHARAGRELRGARRGRLRVQRPVGGVARRRHAARRPAAQRSAAPPRVVGRARGAEQLGRPVARRPDARLPPRRARRLADPAARPRHGRRERTLRTERRALLATRRFDGRRLLYVRSTSTRQELRLGPLARRSTTRDRVALPHHPDRPPRRRPRDPAATATAPATRAASRRGSRRARPRASTDTLWTHGARRRDARVRDARLRDAAAAARRRTVLSDRGRGDRPRWSASGRCDAGSLEPTTQSRRARAATDAPARLQSDRPRRRPQRRSTPNGPVATATTRSPSARAQAMSRGVSPITTVRSRGHVAGAARGRSAGRRSRSSASEPKPPWPVREPVADARARELEPRDRARSCRSRARSGTRPGGRPAPASSLGDARARARGDRSAGQSSS